MSETSTHDEEMSYDGGSGSPGGGALPGDFSLTLQAEDAALSGDAAIADAIGGAQDGSYVMLPGDGESAIAFTVTVPRDGFYTLEFRHALGGTTDATRNLLVDGEDTPGAVTFPNLFADDVWGSARERLDLSAGTHTIVLSADLGDETIGIGTVGTDLVLDSVSVTEGTAPSDDTSTRSLLMNNGSDMLAIHESTFTSAKDFEGFGPYLAQLRHRSDWTVDHLESSTAWFREDTGDDAGRVLAPAFDSTLYFDSSGIMHVDYGDYLPTGEALPVEISREYAMVPDVTLLVERWTLTNQNEVGDPLIIWDMMPTLDLSTDLTQSAEWDERLETWIIEIDRGEDETVWMAWGAFQEMDGQQADDAGGGANAGFRLPYDGDPAEEQGSGPDILGRFASGDTLDPEDRSAAGEGIRLAMTRDDIELYPTRPVELYLYTTMADSREELQENIATALNPQGSSVSGSPTFWFERTEAVWEERLAQAKSLPTEGERAITDPALVEAYERSLVAILQSQQPEYGSFVAATNPAYEFKVWPRDSAVTAISLDSAGLHDDAGRYWRWMASVEEDGEDSNPLFEDGTFYTNYSFFEANQGIDFVQPEWDSQGLFLIGAYRHVEALREVGREADAEAFLADPVVRDALIDSAEFIRNGIDETGFGPPELSIWEEFFLYNVYTQVTYSQGLNAAALMADDLDVPELEAGWREGATTIRDAMLRPTTAETPGLWNEEEGHFIWGITPDGETVVNRQENSANLAIVTGLLDANDPRAFSQIAASIENTSHDTYGISRYVGDTFYSSSPFSPGGTYESRVDEAVWPQMTSYVGMAKEYQGDADWALGSLQWTVAMYGEEFMPPGEGVDWSTREPLPSTMVEPVTGGWYVLNLLNFAGLNDLRLPPVDAPANAPPDGIVLSDLRVASYLGAGAMVAEIAGSDPDGSDGLTFDFAPDGNPRGFFAIEGDSLELARPLPFTNGALLDVTLRVTDESGATFDESFVIEVGRDVVGTAAGERIAGRESHDRLQGLAGDDELLGGGGDDLLEGGEGNDLLAGGDGADTLDGGAGHDRLAGGIGDDLIVGGDGQDTISAGEGADTVSGGGDNGIAELRGPPGQQRVVVTDGDYIDLRLPGSGLPDGDADLLLYNVGTDGVDVVRGFEAGLDVLRITLNDDSLDMQEVVNGTWVGFAEDAGGVLLLGASGLTLGTDVVIA